MGKGKFGDESVSGLSASMRQEDGVLDARTVTDPGATEVMEDGVSEPNEDGKVTDPKDKDQVKQELQAADVAKLEGDANAVKNGNLSDKAGAPITDNSTGRRDDDDDDTPELGTGAVDQAAVKEAERVQEEAEGETNPDTATNATTADTTTEGDDNDTTNNNGRRGRRRS